MMRRAILSAMMIAIIAALPAVAAACACCVPPGAYFTGSHKLHDHEIQMLNDMKFGNKAILFLTEADFELIKGLDGIKEESSSDIFISSNGEFDLVNAFSNGTWRFDLVSPGGKKGTLMLPLPKTVSTFKVDIHDNDTGSSPLLYKELRFSGKVTSGTGIFRAGIARTASFNLIFQGRGNGCDNATDFSHWRLDVKGLKAQYEFFGKMDVDAAAAAEAAK